jgi:hypothetical protein
MAPWLERTLFGLAPFVLVGCWAQGEPCVEHAECAQDEFCHQERCTAVFGREYNFVMVGAEVGAARPDGNPWAGDGTPDLYAVFGFVGQDHVCQTSAVEDSLEPLWNQSCELDMERGDTFGIELWDGGAQPDQLIAAWVWSQDDDLVSLARELESAVVVTDVSGTVDLAYAVEP